jgi:hypothetical protein
VGQGTVIRNYAITGWLSSALLILAVLAKTLDQARREAAERLREQVRQATPPDPVEADPTRLPLDPVRMRGVPCVGPHGIGSAIHGTQPGHGLFDDDE